MNKITPSDWLILPSSANKSSKNEAPIMIGTSKRMSCCATINGEARADTPRINSTLKILLPSTFPKAMSGCPAKLD